MNDMSATINQRIKSRGYSRRSFASALSAKLGLRTPLHHRTVERYVSGDSPWPEGYAEKAAILLFDLPAQRKAFRSQVEDWVQGGKQKARNRNVAKKAYNAVKNSYECQVDWFSDIQHDKFQKIEVTATVTIKHSREVLLTVSSYAGMRWRGVQGGKNPFQVYCEYCDQNHVNKLGLLELLRRSIAASFIAQLLTDGKFVIVEAQRYSSWLTRYKSVLRVLNGEQKLVNKSQKDDFCEKELIALTGDMTAFERQPEEMQKALKKLQRTLQGFSKRLSS